ncbi:MAG: MarR family winged helix-turn-helix transcriptional regulator [Pseudomonadota bacterium]
MVTFVTNKGSIREMPKDLSEFLPYLLHRAAEQTSIDFQRHYKDRYGMLRTEWRVLFHIGHHPGMTAKGICEIANLHKTKVSRAVRALDEKRFLRRETQDHDRRSETLSLTKAGLAALDDLGEHAEIFDRAFEDALGPSELETLKRSLLKLIDN